MSGSLDTGRVGRVFETVLQRDSRPLMLRGLSSWRLHRIPAHVAASPGGLLPAFLTAGDALLREATGQGIETALTPDRQALLGYRVERVAGTRFTDVMLAMIEAVDQIDRGGRLMADDLTLVTALSRSRTTLLAAPALTDPGPVAEPAARIGPSP
ncbi:MAG: hypothetical protein PHT60_15030 [Acidiphilium sp.]|nr:hypothetical protein [Acidiphilium sp.]MDD4937076.1 hypothetical protein [Acidiphilium sp.]